MSIQRRSDELVDLLRPDFVGNDGTASPSFVWVCAGDGTAAAPGFRFCADPDTGFYRPGANQIGVSTGANIVGLWERRHLFVNTATANIFGAPANAGVVGIWSDAADAGSQLQFVVPDLTGASRAGEVLFFNLDGGAGVVSQARVIAERDGADDAMRLAFHTEATGAAESEKASLSGAGDWRLVGFHRQSQSVGVRAYRDAAFVHNNTGNWLAIDFNQQRWDDPDDDQWVIGTPTRLTCQFDGIYVISGHVVWDGNATGERRIGFYLNGTTFIAEVNNINLNTDQVIFSPATTYKLSVGDYLELHAYQNSGGNLNILVAANWSPEFSMVRIA